MGVTFGQSLIRLLVCTTSGMNGTISSLLEAVTEAGEFHGSDSSCSSDKANDKADALCDMIIASDGEC